MAFKLTYTADVRAALDKGNAAAVEDATALFARAIDEVRAIGGWHGSPEIIGKLQHAMKLADAARARVNYLTDINRRRFELLCKAVGVDTPEPSYNRKAQLRA